MINWLDRRFIGTLFLASGSINVPTNPRKWIVQGGNVDIFTPTGLMAFQNAVLSYANNAVSILKRADAQGMIIWDIEGEEPGGVYYGAPEMIGDIAPEMESITTYKGIPMALCDAFFQTFKDAGLKIGLCVRPQRIRSGTTVRWYNEAVTPAEEYVDMRNSIEYARNRWDCTLFYIDSNAQLIDSFQKLNSDFPNVLLIPEHSHSTVEFYRYTTPFKSFHHFGSTHTNPWVSRERNFPGAFSVIFGVEPNFGIGGVQPTPEVAAQRRKNIIDGMRNGDVYGVNSWYWHAGIENLMTLRKESEIAAIEEPMTFHS